jgi:hypothetical protein
MRPPVNIDQLRQAITDADAIPLEAGGRTFIIRPPELLSDDEYAQLQAADEADITAQARIMVDDYDGFVAAGGSAMLLGRIIGDAEREKEATQGKSSGESEGSSGS